MSLMDKYNYNDITPSSLCLCPAVPVGAENAIACT